MRKAIKATAVVSGVNCEGQNFTETVEFTLAPPKKDEPHYGNGYYMGVKIKGQPSFCGRPTFCVDLRYEAWFDGDIEEPASRWLRNWYGNNMMDCQMNFEYGPKEG